MHTCAYMYIYVYENVYGQQYCPRLCCDFVHMITMQKAQSSQRAGVQFIPEHALTPFTRT